MIQDFPPAKRLGFSNSPQIVATMNGSTPGEVTIAAAMDSGWLTTKSHICAPVIDTGSSHSSCTRSEILTRAAPGDRMPIGIAERPRVHLHALGHVVGRLTGLLEQCDVRIGVGKQSPSSVLLGYIPTGYLNHLSYDPRHRKTSPRSMSRVEEVEPLAPLYALRQHTEWALGRRPHSVMDAYRHGIIRPPSPHPSPHHHHGRGSS